MKLLTKAMQDDMARQMVNKARDVDMCMFNALDGTMEKEYLLDCLMFYQAKDGGFQGGLHIDNYNTNSSVYQVYEAFRLLDMLDFDSSCTHELFDRVISKACNYLYNRCQLEDNRWNPNVKSNNDFAHSILFTYNDENKKLFGYHPTAAILGYTLLFNKPTKAYYKKALKMIEEILPKFYQKESLSKYEAISFGSLYNSLKKLNLLEEDRNKIKEKLLENAKKNISTNYENPDLLHPLEALLYLDTDEFKDEINDNLDYLVSSVKSFGLLDHIGTWGHNIYPEEDSAMIKWIGAETVNNYYLLKKYGRIE